MQKSKFLNRLNANEYALYGEIVADAGYKWSGDAVCPSDVLDMLEEAGGNDILLHVNSPGGDVFSGFAIYNQLQSYPGKVTVKIEGLAASIASVIVLAADEIIMPENAYMMVHRSWCYTWGNAEDLQQQADILERLDKSILEVYQQHLNNAEDVDKLKEKIDAETWMNARETAELFSGITVTKADKIAACAGAAAALNKFGAKLPEGMAETDEKAQMEAQKLRLQLQLLEMEGE